MGNPQRRRILAPLALAAAAGIMLAGCSGNTGGGSSGDNTVTVYGTIVGDEAKLLQQSWSDWAKKNDIKVKYEGNQEFEKQIGIRAQGGNPPDVAIFPQPGLFADFATRGYLKEAPASVKANAEKYWSKDWQNYGTVDGKFWGAPLMANVKGWVWYSPAKFQEWGVEVPKTWDEMMTLTSTIEAKTGKPAWCAGFGSDAATGWPGTDWIEDYIIRFDGTQVYDDWVKGKIKFTDPRIKDAFNAVGKVLLDPKNVNAGIGDVKSINSTPFGDVANPVVKGDCALTHQASFFDGFLSEAGGQVGPDKAIWAFMTPPKEAGGQAITGGGEIVGGFSDKPAVQKFLTYLSSPEWANSRVKLGGVISANKGLKPENASSPILKESIKILQDDKTTLRFDGSDLMPGAVGAGTFWKGMVAWVNGTPVDQVVEQIQAGWPSN
jgi:alpha-glucoside transport system substrate-binding protein